VPQAGMAQQGKKLSVSAALESSSAELYNFRIVQQCKLDSKTGRKELTDSRKFKHLEFRIKT